MRLSVRVLVVAGVATVVVVGGGVLALGGSDEPDGSGSSGSPFTTTALASYDTLSVPVSRQPFCEVVDPRQVAAALDGEPDSSTSWQNGDSVEVADGVEDVVHEFGCEYVGADGTLARAWVFAPAVATEQGERLVRSASKGPGCEAGEGPRFGEPTLALVCTKDGIARASYRGLFGDAWLVCEVVRPTGATWDAADRAGRWCVGVLEAASTPSSSG